jgi:hypothetical protein
VRLSNPNASPQTAALAAECVEVIIRGDANLSRIPRRSFGVLRVYQFLSLGRRRLGARLQFCGTAEQGGHDQQRLRRPPALRQRISLGRGVSAPSRHGPMPTNASAKSFRNCDPSGSLSNLRLETSLDFVALHVA